MNQYCWEIIQCDSQHSCPAGTPGKKECWEVMQDNDSFQCHYGLCEDCLVYLSKTSEKMFTSQELKEILQNRNVVTKIL